MSGHNGGGVFRPRPANLAGVPEIMTHGFHDGDVVFLKSGGVPMTVQKATERDITVIYFTQGAPGACSHNIAPHCLVSREEFQKMAHADQVAAMVRQQTAQREAQAQIEALVEKPAAVPE